MILFDQPYVSDFMLDTAKRNNFPVISTKAARAIINDPSLNWISEEEAIKIYINNPNCRLHSNSENAIAWIEENLNSSELLKQIQVFKNKIRFRELLKDEYPDYFFTGIKYEHLREFNIDDLNFPFIIKPAVGFFSLGVYKVDTSEDWIPTLEKIEAELDSIQDFYPKQVVNVEDFIIEELIEGEEFAIDSYFDEAGEPVILNILHHVFSSSDDVSDRIYSTSKKIMDAYLEPFKSFLQMLGIKAKLKNFPVHVEVRVDDFGKIIPIEVNPLRFGGWCTTGDQSYFAYGFNSHEYFLKNKKPDWPEILKTRANKKFSIIVLDNNSGYKHDEIEKFDYDLLLKDFVKPLDLRKVIMKEYPVFGFLFVETNEANEQELNQILNSDLRKYIQLKSQTVN